MSTGSAYSINFTINDRTRGYPQRDVQVAATPQEIDSLVRDGYLLRRGLIPSSWLDEFRVAVDKLVVAEKDHPQAERLAGNGLYIRALLDKDTTFHRLLTFEPVASVARAVLGPQVEFGSEARVAFPGVANAGVNWHIHMRVIPQPLPPFFCYPHQIHGIVYLDHVSAAEGQLCVLPGSHLDATLDLPDDSSDQPGQVALEFEPGDVILMHGNLWHRTVPTSAECRQRRLILFGYSPAWIKSDITRGVPAEHLLTADLSREGEITDELLGGFHW